jgi:hypothetical protein
MTTAPQYIVPFTPYKGHSVEEAFRWDLPSSKVIETANIRALEVRPQDRTFMRNFYGRDFVFLGILPGIMIGFKRQTRKAMYFRSHILVARIGFFLICLRRFGIAIFLQKISSCCYILLLDKIDL